MGHYTTATSFHTRLGRWTRRCSWPLIISFLAIAAIALLAGMVALILDLAPDQRGKLFNLAEAFGATGTALGAVYAFWKQIRQKYAVIRLQQAKGHVVICGLGSMGRHLVDTFITKGYLISVIEANHEHPEIPGCRERGVVVITADAADQATLEEANTARAHFLFAVTGNDSSNIEIARLARLLTTIEFERDDSVKLRCYCHVTSSAARDIFSRHELFEPTHDGYDASLFSVFDASARYLMEKHPPDPYALQDVLPGEPLRILVIGFGHLGEALVKQTARIGHYLHWQECEITVVATDAASAESRFLGAYGDSNIPARFSVPGVSVRFIDKNPEDIGCLDELYPQGSPPPATIYLAIDNDLLGASLAVRMRRIPGADQVPIVVCMTSDLSRLMADNEFPFMAAQNIHVFNPYIYASDYPILMEEVIDELAKGIHTAYCTSLAGDSPTDNPSLVSWRDLPEDKKDANRWQADHLSVKLRAIGFDHDGIPALDHAMADQNLIARLADMEHRRWSAVMLIDGWRYAPGKKDSLRKTHPSLVPFIELSEAERAKDDTMIRNMKAMVTSQEWGRFQKYMEIQR